MKNIIWKNLIQNIIRCIIAYPLFLILFVISFPFNIFGWFIWIFEFVIAFAQFIFIGGSFIKYSTIGYLITDFSFEYLIFVLFPVTFSLIKAFNYFNDTLYPIKRS